MSDGSVVIDTKLNNDGINKGISKLKSGFSKIGSIATTALKGVAVTIGAVSTALTGLGIASVNSYADLEQNVGGIETLFKGSAEKVIKNAENAYKTAGMSANEYMSTVTSFSASLLQSLGGDTEKAANSADMAITDMADNANKMGTSMELIQNAYQGFAKQNYTMLDNLKLGYGGTKEEMQRLLVDAEKITGIKYDISNLNDVYNAIHVIQGELGITGTTAKEAASTITGSISSMKSAFDNFLNGSGTIKQLVETGITSIQNIVNVAGELLPNIVQSIANATPQIVDGINKIFPQILNILTANAPTILSSIEQILVALLQVIINYIPQLMPVAIQLIESFITGLLSMLPQILQMGITLLVELIKGIAQMLPELIPMTIEIIMTMFNTIIENLPTIIEAGLELLVSLIQGIVNAIPKLIEMLPTIITTICEVITKELPNIIKAGITILVSLINGLIDAIPQLVEMLPTIISTIVITLIENLPLIIDAGIQILIALINGLIEAIPMLIEMLPQIITTIVTVLAQNFPKIVASGGKIITSLVAGIVSLLSKIGEATGRIIQAIWNVLKELPGKALQWGKDMIQGFIDGIKAMISKVTRAVSNVANKVKEFLHFSRPDKGPLREYEKWMPDMVKGLAKTLEQSAPQLYNASKMLAEKINDGLDLSNIYEQMQANVDLETAKLSTNLTSSATLQLAKEQPKTVTNDNGIEINCTQQFYSKNSTPYEEQKQAKQQLRRLAYGL